MGMIVRARCSCGLDKELAVGGGVSNFKTFAAFPARCDHCRDLMVINMLAPRLMCEKCGNTDVTPLDEAASPGASQVAGWNLPVKRTWWGSIKRAARSLALHDQSYRCPRCGKTELRFAPGRMFD